MTNGIPLVVSSSPPQTLIVTAHESQWANVLSAIFKALNAASPFLVSVVPAPIEAGIQIAGTLGPVIVQATETPHAQQ